MPRISRREFAAAATALSAGPLQAKAKISIDETLKGGIERRKIPCVTAMVADSHRVLYRGAFGTRDAASGTPVKIDSIFSIASMTKAITSLAAVQLVEAKKVSLDEPAEKYLAELRGRQVLDGFAADGHATQALTYAHVWALLRLVGTGNGQVAREPRGYSGYARPVDV